MRLPKNDGLNIVPFIDIILESAFGKLSFMCPLAINVDMLSTMQSNTSIISIKGTIFKLENSDFIEIKSDKESKFETFVWIIDMLKEKNHENFSIVTKND